MTENVKLAKFILEHGSLEDKIKNVVTNSLSEYLFEPNNIINRKKMINDIEVHLTELENEIGIELNITSEERTDEIIYYIYYLDKMMSLNLKINTGI